MPLVFLSNFSPCLEMGKIMWYFLNVLKKVL